MGVKKLTKQSTRKVSICGDELLSRPMVTRSRSTLKKFSLKTNDTVNMSLTTNDEDTMDTSVAPPFLKSVTSLVRRDLSKLNLDRKPTSKNMETDISVKQNNQSNDLDAENVRQKRKMPRGTSSSPDAKRVKT